jgi:nucleotide-binding universal stress UspA family protein
MTSCGCLIKSLQPDPYDVWGIQVTGNDLVVAGVDETPESLHAVEFAAAEACLRGASLRIVHATSWPYLGAPVQRPFTESDRDRLEASNEAMFARAVDCANAHLPESRLERRLVTGAPEHVLTAEAADCLLLVVGRRIGQVARLRSTSVVSRVALTAAVPVIVVQGISEPGANIIAGIGTDPNTQDGLRFAYEEARLRNAGITAIHAWRSPVVAAHGVSGGMALAGEQQNNAEAARFLAEQLAGWTTEFPDIVVRRAVPEGSAVDALVQASINAQMVVLGRPEGVTGSVLLHEVIRRALCPVAIAPAGP